MESELVKSLDDVSSKLNGGSKEAVDWFRNRLKDMIDSHEKKSTRAQNYFPVGSGLEKSFMTKKLHTRSVGRMMMYVYDAKWKNKLPYWDALPLVIVVDMTPDGFTGLNLHYVPPLLRKNILNILRTNLPEDAPKTDRVSNKEMGGIKMSYAALKEAASFPIMKPCFKRYLFSQVRSSFMFIDPKEWDNAVMLPTERFQKAGKNRVFRESTGASGKKKTRKGGTVKAREAVKPTPARKPTNIKTTKFFEV